MKAGDDLDWERDWARHAEGVCLVGPEGRCRLCGEEFPPAAGEPARRPGVTGGR